MAVDPEAAAQHRLSISAQVVGDTDARVRIKAMRGPAGNGDLAVNSMPFKTRQGGGAAGTIGLDSVIGIPDHDALVFIGRVPLAFVFETHAIMQREPASSFPGILSVKIILVIDDIIDEVGTCLGEAVRVANQHICIVVEARVTSPGIELPLANGSAATAGAFRLHIGVTRPEKPELHRMSALDPSEVIAEVGRVAVFPGGAPVPLWSRAEGRSVQSGGCTGAIAATTARRAAPAYNVRHLGHWLSIRCLNVIVVRSWICRSGVFERNRVDEIGVAECGLVDERRANRIRHSEAVVASQLSRRDLRRIWHGVARPPPQAYVVDVCFRLAGKSSKGAHL